MRGIYFALTVTLLSFSYQSHAQIGDWLKRKKEDLTQKAKDKADQRIYNSADSILSKSDSIRIGSGKHKKSKKDKEGTRSSSDTSVNKSTTFRQNNPNKGPVMMFFSKIGPNFQRSYEKLVWASHHTAHVSRGTVDVV